MYKDAPARVLNEKVKENVFVNDPYRNKVIGLDSDIKRITKEEVELCFNSFYNPSNMFLIIVGNFDKDKAIKVIKENLSDEKNSKKIEKVYDMEPDKINKKYEEIKFNIDVPRISVAYKFNKDMFKFLNISSYELDLYLHILISVALGPTSKKREEWIKKDLFLSSMYRIIENESHYVIEFSALTNSPDQLREELLRYLKDLKIDRESFDREKKLWVAGEIESISDIGSIKYNIIDDILDYGQFISNKIDIINKLDYKILEKLKKTLNFTDDVTVKLMPTKEKK